MCVPSDGGDAPVEPVCERDLLARRLGVDVHDHDRGLLARLVDQSVDDLPEAPGRLEEQRTEKIDDRYGGPSLASTTVSPRPGEADGMLAGRMTRSLEVSTARSPAVATCGFRA